MNVFGKGVYSLCIDLIGSTKFGLELNTRQLDQFNLALISQLKPHLESVGLDDVLVKFTGDGWLVMTDDVQLVSSLCCLGLIMANKFQTEISDLTKINAASIPQLRIAICFGRDVKVELPDGRTDWVGDSARRATRASGYCAPNTILIDETVKNIVFRDFTTEHFDPEGSVSKPKRSEEELSLYVLTAIKGSVAADIESTGYIINALDILGRREEALNRAETTSEQLAQEIQKPHMDENSILLKWNQLIGSRVDYATAVEIFERLASAHLSPDFDGENTLERESAGRVAPNVVTYNTIMSLAPDYEEAKKWLERMREENIAPDVVTYNTLMNLASDYREAEKWLERMREENIAPDVVTYNTLMNLAPDYWEAEKWLDRMREENIAPNIITYNTLMNLAPDYLEAEKWMNRMREENLPPDVITYNTLMNLAPDYLEAEKWLELRREENS